MILILLIAGICFFGQISKINRKSSQYVIYNKLSANTKWSSSAARKIIKLNLMSIRISLNCRFNNNISASAFDSVIIWTFNASCRIASSWRFRGQFHHSSECNRPRPKAWAAHGRTRDRCRVDRSFREYHVVQRKRQSTKMGERKHTKPWNTGVHFRNNFPAVDRQYD